MSYVYECEQCNKLFASDEEPGYALELCDSCQKNGSTSQAFEDRVNAKSALDLF